MSYVQYPYEVLSQLGQNLVDVGTKLSEKQRGAQAVDGLGSDGQSRIQDSINDFRHTWKASAAKLIGEIGDWGGLSKAIGDMVSQFDAQVASQLNPSGGPSTAPTGHGHLAR